MPGPRPLQLAFAIKSCLESYAPYHILSERLLGAVREHVKDTLDMDISVADLQSKFHGGRTAIRTNWLEVAHVQKTVNEDASTGVTILHWAMAKDGEDHTEPVIGANNSAAVQKLINRNMRGDEAISEVTYMVVSLLCDRPARPCHEDLSKTLLNPDNMDFGPNSHIRTMAGLAINEFDKTIVPLLKGNNKRDNRFWMAERLLEMHNIGTITLLGLDSIQNRSPTWSSNSEVVSTVRGSTTVVEDTPTVDDDLVEEQYSMSSPREKQIHSSVDTVTPMPMDAHGELKSAPSTTFQFKGFKPHLSTPSSIAPAVVEGQHALHHEHIFHIDVCGNTIQLTVFEQPGSHLPERHSRQMLVAAIAVLRPIIFHCGLMGLAEDPPAVVDALLLQWAHQKGCFHSAVYSLPAYANRATNPDWWSTFIATQCTPLNPNGDLLTRLEYAPSLWQTQDRVGQGLYMVRVQDVSKTRAKYARREKKIATQRIQHAAAISVVQAIRKHRRETAGARMIGSMTSQRTWDKMNQHNRNGRKLFRLPHGVNDPAEQPGRVVNKQHLASMQAAGVSCGDYIHRDKSTGRCVLSALKDAPEGHEVVGLGQWFGGWAREMLLAEEKEGRLNFSLSDRRMVCTRPNNISVFVLMTLYFVLCDGTK